MTAGEILARAELHAYFFDGQFTDDMFPAMRSAAPVAATRHSIDDPEAAKVAAEIYCLVNHGCLLERSDRPDITWGALDAGLKKFLTEES